LRHKEVGPTIVYAPVKDRQDVGVHESSAHDRQEVLETAKGRRPERMAIHKPEIQVVTGRQLHDGKGVSPIAVHRA
jgi:hypothetical protein